MPQTAANQPQRITNFAIPALPYRNSFIFASPCRRRPGTEYPRSQTRHPEAATKREKGTRNLRKKQHSTAQRISFADTVCRRETGTKLSLGASERSHQAPLHCGKVGKLNRPALVPVSIWRHDTRRLEDSKAGPCQKPLLSTDLPHGVWGGRLRGLRLGHDDV